MSELQLGFGLPVSGSWASTANLVEFAQRADQLGYHSLWSFQRLLHPVDGDWGPMYRAVHDPIVTLGYVAAVTRRARLGVAVLNAPFYQPIMLAKQLTTLDLLSNGRLDTGLGLGWADEEFAAVGVARSGRAARTEEFIACLAAIWSEDPVQFDGKYYSVPAAHVDPKPVQQPRPPILLGGGAEPALQRAGRLADGWVSASRHDLRQIGTAVATVQHAAERAGRDPGALRFIVRAVIRMQDRPDGSAERRPLHGDVDQIKADLAALHEQGVTEAFIDLNFDPQVGSPSANPVNSVSYAREVLEAFAPVRPE